MISKPARRRFRRPHRARAVTGLAAAALAIPALSGMALSAAVLAAPAASAQVTPVQVTLPFTGLSDPFAVATDSAGNIYVTDDRANDVLELEASSGQQVILPFTGLDRPEGVAVDSAGNVYVADDGNSRVVELPAGSSQQVTLPFTGLVAPTGVAVDQLGNVYVTDSYTNQVVELQPGSGKQVTLPFTGLDEPLAVAVDVSGNVYVANGDNSQVVELTSSGTQVTLPFSGLDYPEGLAVDAGGDVYAGSRNNSEVVELQTSSGAQVSLPFSGLNEPYGVALDLVGNVYAVDGGNNRVVELVQAPIAQAITFTSTPPSPAVAGGSYTPTATGGGSGNPVTFSIDSNSTAGACSIGASGTVSFTGAGSCLIDANQAAGWNAGSGYAAAPQAQQVITVASPPGAPVIGTATPGNGSATVSFSPPADDGGAAITGYTLTAADATNPANGGQTAAGTGSPITVTGLTNGDSYTFTVTAANSSGTGPASAASNAVTPEGVPSFTADSPPLTAATGTPYSYHFAATGDPSYALTGAPSWLSVNASTGLVTGTPPTGTRSFSYAVTASNFSGSATTGTFTVAVTSNADIAASLTCPAGLTVGESGTCTLTVTNAGPALALKTAAGAVVTGPLKVTGCTGGCSDLLGVLGWTLGSLPAGQSVTLTIDVTASRAGTAVVAAAAAAANPDPNLLNNIAGATVKVTAS